MFVLSAPEKDGFEEFPICLYWQNPVSVLVLVPSLEFPLANSVSLDFWALKGNEFL